MSVNELWTEPCGLGQWPDGVQTVLTTDPLSSATLLKPVDTNRQRTVTSTCLRNARYCGNVFLSQEHFYPNPLSSRYIILCAILLKDDRQYYGVTMSVLGHRTILSYTINL